MRASILGALLALVLALVAPGIAGELDIRNPVADIPLAKLSATREKPLFAPSRRPAPMAAAMAPLAAPPVVEAEAPEPEIGAPSFKLVGTVVGDEDRIAIVTDPATNVTKRAREGESIERWTVRSIDPRSAVFEDSTGRRATLSLPAPNGTDAAQPRVSAAPGKTNIGVDASVSQ